MTWEVFTRLNPVHGRAVSAVTATVVGVVILAVLCLRLTQWNSTQATRLFVAMPLSSVFRTMLLAAIPATFVALFLMVPWLVGTQVAARTAGRSNRLRLHLMISAWLVATVSALLALLGLVEHWPGIRLAGYGTAMIVAFVGGYGAEWSVATLKPGWRRRELVRHLAVSWVRTAAAIGGTLILIAAVALTLRPIFEDPPRWLAWQCLRISIPNKLPADYEYPDLPQDRDVRVYVVADHNGRQVILAENNRHVYLIDKDWVTANRFCKLD